MLLVNTLTAADRIRDLDGEVRAVNDLRGKELEINFDLSHTTWPCPGNFYLAPLARNPNDSMGARDNTTCRRISSTSAS